MSMGQEYDEARGTARVLQIKQWSATPRPPALDQSRSLEAGQRPGCNTPKAFENINYEDEVTIW